MAKVIDLKAEKWGHPGPGTYAGYKKHPPKCAKEGGSIKVLIPGMNDDELSQYGVCSGCHTNIDSNRKFIYCPNCGTQVELT